MSGQLVTVAGFSSIFEAQIACGQLRSAGIAARVPDQLAVGTVGDLIGGATGVRVQVPEQDLELARQILELPEIDAPEPSLHTASEAKAEPSAPRGWRSADSRALTNCPACGEDLTAAESWPWALRSLLARMRSGFGRCPGCARDLRDFA